MTARLAIGQRVIPNLATFNGFAGGNQAWSSWAQLQAAGVLDRDFVLCGAYHAMGVVTAASGNSFRRLYVEIGYGASGAEVAVASFQNFGWINKSAAAETVLIGFGGTVFVEPAVIPARSRVAVRGWGNASGVQNSVLLFGYYRDEWEALMESPDYEEYARGAAMYRAAISPSPAAAADLGATVTSGSSAWSYGDWVTLIAAGQVVRPVYVRAIHAGIGAAPTAGNTQFQIQLGVGAAGEEVPLDVVGQKTTVGVAGQSPGGAQVLWRPLYVPPNTRVAVRAASLAPAQPYDVSVGYGEGR